MLLYGETLLLEEVLIVTDFLLLALWNRVCSGGGNQIAEMQTGLILDSSII